VVDALASPEPFNRVPDHRKLRFVFIISGPSEISKICTQDHVSSCIVRIIAKIVDKVLRSMMQGAIAPDKMARTKLINAVAPLSVAFTSVVVSIAERPGDAGRVDHPIVAVQRIGGEAKNKITDRRRATDHWFANRQ
jgi:hypothetical protein